MNDATSSSNFLPHPLLLSACDDNAWSSSLSNIFHLLHTLSQQYSLHLSPFTLHLSTFTHLFKRKLEASSFSLFPMLSLPLDLRGELISARWNPTAKLKKENWGGNWINGEGLSVQELQLCCVMMQTRQQIQQVLFKIAGRSYSKLLIRI